MEGKGRAREGKGGHWRALEGIGGQRRATEGKGGEYIHWLKASASYVGLK
jgi:hypothetical protein